VDINGSSAPRRKALARRRATHENRLGLEVDAEAGEHVGAHRLHLAGDGRPAPPATLIRLLQAVAVG